MNHDGVIALQRNVLVKTISVLKITFQLSLDVWLEPRGGDVWQNVIHFTTGIDSSRLPAIFTGNNKKCIVVFQSITFICSNLLTSYRWVNLEISQQFLNKKVGNIAKF